MIVIEGPDGSGKTSLIKKLQEDLGLPLVPKAVSSQAETVTNIRRWVDRSLEGGWKPELYDRHFLISEGIYGPAWNSCLRDPANDSNWLRDSHNRWAEIQPTIIICLPPIEEVAKNIRKDETNSLLFPTTDRHLGRVPQSVSQIYWPYYWLSRKDPGVLEYDYTVDDYHLFKGYLASVIGVRTT